MHHMGLKHIARKCSDKLRETLIIFVYSKLIQIIFFHICAGVDISPQNTLFVTLGVPWSTTWNFILNHFHKKGIISQERHAVSFRLKWCTQTF